MPKRVNASPGSTKHVRKGRIMVLIGNDASAARLVELGYAMAQRSSAYWLVAHVTPIGISGKLPPGPLQDALVLAERHGAEVTALTGQDLVSEVLAYAGEHRIDQIVVGRSRRPWRWLKLRPSLSSALVSNARGTMITVVTERIMNPGKALSRRWMQPRRLSLELPALLAGPAATLIAAGLGWLLAHYLSTPNLSLVFLVAVLAVAVRYGRLPALFTALLGFLVFNFFFTAPTYTFRVSNRQDVLTISFFLVVALIAGHFGARVRRQILIVRDNSRLNSLLYEFSRRLNAAVGQSEIVRTLQEYLAESTGMESRILLSSVHGLQPADAERIDVYTPAEKLAAESAFDQEETLPPPQQSDPGDWQFIPMRSATQRIGVLGLRTRGAPLSPISRRLITALRDQAAIALDKQRLADEIAHSKLEAETERLRAALLSSVSHDLRTPLVSIIGAASTLLELGAKIDSNSSRQLLGELLKEAERLNRFVQNLLDMTQLGYGALKPDMQWHDVRDIVADAMRGLHGVLRDLSIETQLSGDPMIHTDAVLARQILLNLLDNAAKYAPNGTVVHIEMEHQREPGVFRIAVEDQGPGVPVQERAHVFDLFYRVRKGDRQIAGTGLGLAICRDFVRALGGRISVTEGAQDRGARFEIELPQPPIPDRVQE